MRKQTDAKKKEKGAASVHGLRKSFFLIDIKQRKRFNKKRDPERADCLKDSRPSVLSVFYFKHSD